jgi:hypothetical protein
MFRIAASTLPMTSASSRNTPSPCLSGLEDLHSGVAHVGIACFLSRPCTPIPASFGISRPHDAGALRCMLSATLFTTSKTSFNISTVYESQGCLFAPISTTRVNTTFSCRHQSYGLRHLLSTERQRATWPHSIGSGHDVRNHSSLTPAGLLLRISGASTFRRGLHSPQGRKQRPFPPCPCSFRGRDFALSTPPICPTMLHDGPSVITYPALLEVHDRLRALVLLDLPQVMPYAENLSCVCSSIHGDVRSTSLGSPGLGHPRL